jgi:hypothetical protein
MLAINASGRFECLRCPLDGVCMRLQLLGPVRGWVGPQPIHFGVRKQRLVLAVLALEVNTLVPTTRLMDGPGLAR